MKRNEREIFILCLKLRKQKKIQIKRKGFSRLYIVKYNFVGFGSIDDTMKNTGKEKKKEKKDDKKPKKNIEMLLLSIIFGLWEY